ncbi:MAG TPA: carboxypeptidase-like regulatory domain-containing protein, partial [Vicinamibacterales bacterium]|nr:carboxypeptidase-like regulatory domain-containing protein [Vicinamibacterales bacterium]
MRALRNVLAVSFLLVLVAMRASAQQATIAGVVTDESKAVLPGVTVTVTDIAKGTQLVAVSDARGEYRVLQLAPGTYKLQAELEGFASVVQDKISILVGQNVTVPVVMKVATVSETLTVTGQSPLVDTTSTQVAGNINPTQMQEVPLLGRNWLELSKMVPGMTANVISTYAPGVSANNWAMNLDGQMVA